MPDTQPFPPVSSSVTAPPPPACPFRVLAITTRGLPDVEIQYDEVFVPAHGTERVVPLTVPGGGKSPLGKAVLKLIEMYDQEHALRLAAETSLDEAQKKVRRQK